MYQFKTQQFLPITIEEAWLFFSSPNNLPFITPPELDFKILTPSLPEETYKGLLIDYTVKPLFGIKIHWQTEISNVTKNIFFIDKQIKGPYKLWEHTHYFEQKENGVIMTDVVIYELPFWFIGKMMHAFVVKRKIEEIFSFRKKTLENLFKNN